MVVVVVLLCWPPRRAVEAPVEGAQLHHVVYQVDDGLEPRHLLLQAPRVLPQLLAPLADKKLTNERPPAHPGSTCADAAPRPPGGQKIN